MRESHPLAELTLQNINEIRLLLRGQSIIDWHRLAFTSREEVLRLLSLNCIDYDNPDDRKRLELLRSQAVSYIGEALHMRLDPQVASKVPWVELPLLASTGTGTRQRHACMLLKVMHIIYHLDARELRTTLAIAEHDLYSRVEESVASMFDALRAAGVPVAEFSWSRKVRTSLITKLLLKRETSAARVFDRLRFRVIVKNPDDLIPTLQIMLQRCIPFNYVVPNQTVNTLIDIDHLRALPGGRVDFEASHGSEEPAANEFSGREFRVLNFIADLPVRLSKIASESEVPEGLHSQVVFVLAEFQILDAETAAKNESGDNSHVNYKNRQHQHVRMRLLREPKH